MSCKALRLSCANPVTIWPKVASRADQVLYWVQNGLNKCSDIAAELDISKGTVSKAAKVLIEAGKLKPPKGGRNDTYELTD